MASTSSQKPFPSISSTRRWKYDVFLSFRGEDTRKNFTDHLYTALVQKGINTFRDTEELERGKEISSDLFQTIGESRFSIIILSKNYASSKWCLDELAKIVDCIETKGHTAFPIFHYVDPSDVRKQTGAFKKHFDKHEQDFKENRQKVQNWREAITKVANLSGWHLHDRYESEFIQEIVEEISSGLNQPFSSVAGDFVGIDSRVKQLIERLEVGSDDKVRFVGIYGMGGIGKTTIARVVYNQLSYQYQGSSFLANVREVSQNKGLVHLQEQLLTKVLGPANLNILDVHEGINFIRKRLFYKKVFLVLDDVDQLEQLNCVVGNGDWFCSGSRIIITTRDEHLLTSHGIKNRYKVEGLNWDESIQLFHSKAFKHNQPTVGHVELSTRVVGYTSGIPLALEVFGSLLCDRSVKEWKSALDRLERAPDEKISRVLRISYDGLNKMEKEIFLDIACFFKGKNKDRVIEVLDSCDFAPDIGITRLVEKSLITVSDSNRLWMHDLLQEMGREIVSEQHPTKPGKWSRLCVPKDIYNVLTRNMGTQAIEGIIFDKPKQGITTNLNGKSFSTMNNLRILKISEVHLCEDLEFLSNELRVLKWLGYPLNYLPPSFEPKELITLNMCHSRIEYLWNDIKPLMKLKTIKLSHSHKLTRTPDVTMVPNLERLDLEGCTGLLEVHESVAVLKRLVVLNLKDCKNLVSFPTNAHSLKSLKVLNLYGCSKIDKLPPNLEEMECLEELDISRTAIRKVQSSIVMLKNLKELSFHGCKGEPPKTWSSSLFSLLLPKRNPNSMCLQLPPLASLRSLKKLDLSDCNIFEGANLKDLGNLSSLEELNLSKNNFVSLPESINQLSKLKTLHLEECKRLQLLPELPPEIAYVGVGDCSSLETFMYALKRSTSSKMKLDLINCFKLVEYQGRENNLAFVLLKHLLQRISNRTSRFDILLPGSKIPEWFSYWSDTTSIVIPLPHNWLSDDQFMGFVFCGVVPPHGGDAILYKVSVGNFNAYVVDFFFCKISMLEDMEHDHLCVVYFSREHILESFTERLSDCGAIGISFPDLNESSKQVKECGILLVYKQDLVYLNARCNFEELPVAEDTSAIVPTTIHRYSIFERIRKYFPGAY